MNNDQSDWKKRLKVGANKEKTEKTDHLIFTIDFGKTGFYKKEFHPFSEHAIQD